MKTLLAFALTIGLLSAHAVLSADNPVPTVDSAELTAFMEKWKTYEAFKFPMAEADRSLLLAALAKDPTGPWYAYLAMQFAGGRFQLRSLPEHARQNAAAKAVTTLKQADQILAAAVKRSGTNTARVITEQAVLRQTLSPFLLEAGPAYLPEARALAQRMAAQLPATNSWDYGNVVFATNELLGRVALREGKLEAARDYLRAAGRAPGSPQLNSAGPDLVFARELLQHRDPADQKAVLGFLDDIAHFWAYPLPGNANARRVSDEHLKELETWKELIRAGKIPDDPKWR